MHSPADETGTGAISRTARLLALLGFVPFAVMSLWLFGIAQDHPWGPVTILLLKSYSLVILSFLGGIRWGLGMKTTSGEGRRDLVASCAPPLAGWAGFFIPVPYAFALFAVAFAAQGAWDAFAVHHDRAPRWFGPTRLLLTVLVVSALILSFAATARSAQPG